MTEKELNSAVYAAKKSNRSWFSHSMDSQRAANWGISTLQYFLIQRNLVEGKTLMKAKVKP